MATTSEVLHCPHCGHSISDQESSSSGLLAYIGQLESYARLPAGLLERLRAGRDYIDSLYMLPVLVARMDHYASLV
jgi:hypothetical protein